MTNKLNNRLKRVVADVDDSMEFIGSQFNPKYKAAVKVASSLEKSQARIFQDLLGLDVLQDEEVLWATDKDRESRNQFRAEIRKALTEYCGGKK